MIQRPPPATPSRWDLPIHAAPRALRLLERARPWQSTARSLVPGQPLSHGERLARWVDRMLTG